MNEAKGLLLCRLCGVDLVNEEFVYIFEESSDLKQKIEDTLPVTILPDDNGSQYICLGCHDKVALYYKFVQDVVEYTKELDNVAKIKSLLDSPKTYKEETTDNFFKIHNDAIYTCPNCNVDLTILLANDPQGCDYTFQISLAIVDRSEKLDFPKEPEFDDSNNVIISENNVNLTDNYNATSDATAGDIERINNKVFSDKSNDIVRNDSAEQLSVNEIQGSQTHGTVKRKSKRTFSADTSSDSKIPKLSLSNSDYDSVSTAIKVEPSDDDSNWIDEEDNCKLEEDLSFEQTEEYLEDNAKSDNENDSPKNCPKIVCDLCGSRYVSQQKYDFHMERHKLGKMDSYICPVCHREARSENLLWDHYFHLHKSARRYVCMRCGKLFTKKAKLNGHQKKHRHSGFKEIYIETEGDNVEIDNDAIAAEIRAELAVNCNLCGKTITDFNPNAINDLVTCSSCEDSTLSLMVDGNEAKVISPRQYHCSKCPKHFVRKERLEFHEMRHNENMKEFVCSTCGKEFSAENSLYEHYMFVHKGVRPHICELCGKSFQLKARLKEHHRTHTGERPFQCDVCGQRCMTTNALRLHRKIHFSHSRYTCNVCNKSFSKKQNMNEHLEKHWKHDKNVTLPQLFTCPLCMENFPTYRMLKYHMMESHEISSQDPLLMKQKPLYECTDCHEQFKHQMSLKAHREKVHEGKVNPMYQCDTCNATYRVKQLLINHIKSKHDGEKRYKCAQCEKGFNDTKSLYNHILLHTGKKPFICEFCNMSFRRKDSRDHHRRKHTGEQPYQCPDCGQSFSTYNNRSKHRKREHGDGETECPECGKVCNGQQEIRVHLNKHLGEKLQKLKSEESS